MSRRTARKNAFKLIYAQDFRQDEDITDMIHYFFEEHQSINEIDKKFIESEVKNTIIHKDELDKYIEEYSTSWNIERLPKIDLAILRLALYEILKDTEIPPSVSVNEAVEIAKQYSGDESPAFINGILGKIIREKSEAKVE